MARKKQHIELEGLYYSDLEFLIKELTVGAYAYRNREILKDALQDGYPCVVLMPGAEDGTHVGILWDATRLVLK